MNYVVKGFISVGGSAISFMYGGWSALLSVLLAFVILDYFTGLMAASVEGTKNKGKGLNSKTGFIGITKKIMIFAMVAVAHLTDTTLGDTHIFRDATIFFYLANELLSIVENSGRIGLPVPSAMKKAVEVLKGRSDAK